MKKNILKALRDGAIALVLGLLAVIIVSVNLPGRANASKFGYMMGSSVFFLFFAVVGISYFIRDFKAKQKARQTAVPGRGKEEEAG